MLNSDLITLSLFGKTLAIPLSGWILGGVSLFFVSTLLLSVKDRIEQFCFQYQLKKDFNALIVQIKSQILGDEIVFSNFKNPFFQTLSKVFGRMKISPNLQTQPSQNLIIDKFFEDLIKLEEGEVSKEDFPKFSYFWEKNICNKIQANSKYAFDVLEGNYPSDLKHKALLVLLSKEESLQDKNVSRILKVDLEGRDCEALLEYFLDKGYNIGLEDFKKLLSQVELKRWISYAQRFSHRFDPDFCLSLFRELFTQSKEAYIYLLLHYSMFEQARECLKESDGELKMFEAYLKLKECGCDYPLDLFTKS